MHYLQWPAGMIFNGMTYPEFWTQFHEVFHVPARTPWPQPPYDNDTPDAVYVDSSDAHHQYCRYAVGSEACVHHQATPMIDIKEACVHLLMLNWPT